MKLTRMIFDYWKHWLRVPEKTILWCYSWGWEGLTYYDGYCMSFWYALNHDWYKMNNKKFAFTGCNEAYEEPRDFEEYEAL